MDKKIVMHEVSGAQDVWALMGCTVTAITGADGDKGDGLILDFKDENDNLVCLSISEDGMHFYDSKREDITVKQYGDLAMLAGCSDIDSVHFNNLDPLIEIAIKPIGPNAADRVMAILKEIFPTLEVNEAEWNFEGELQPMYLCSDQNYYFHITVAVLP